MKSTILYIHGLGSDRHARKFQDLKAYFQDKFRFDFLEWDNHSNIEQLIKEKLDHYQQTKNLIIIGDSTGANFAYQLRELRNCESDKLILTSPLLQIEKLIADFEFPASILNFLEPIKAPQDLMIIATKKDEVLDQTYLFDERNNFKNVQILEIDDSHRLIHFKQVLPMISDYLRDK